MPCAEHVYCFHCSNSISVLPEAYQWYNARARLQMDSYQSQLLCLLSVMPFYLTVEIPFPLLESIIAIAVLGMLRSASCNARTLVTVRWNVCCGVTFQ